MEDKGAIVQQRDRQTVISGEGGGGDTSISPNPEVSFRILNTSCFTLLVLI